MDDVSIAAIESHPYRLALTGPGRALFGPWRTGRLIRMVSATGVVGWGDAAPLPGFSPESLDQLDAGVVEIQKHRNTPAGSIAERFVDSIPSLAFAVEQALCSIEAQSRHVAPRYLISREPRKSIYINGLINTSPEEVGVQASSLVAAGCTCLKVKVGHWDPRLVAETVTRVRDAVDEQVDLLLDANRSWSLDEAVDILTSLEGAGLSYAEEPLQNAEEFPSLAEETSVPLALDESLVGMAPEQLSSVSFASTLILKPTILGGIHRCRMYAAQGAELGMRAVLSSSFESGLGILWLVTMASSRDFDRVAGLDTYSSLSEDVLDPRLELDYTLDVSVADRVVDTPSPHA